MSKIVMASSLYVLALGQKGSRSRARVRPLDSRDGMFECVPEGVRFVQGGLRGLVVPPGKPLRYRGPAWGWERAQESREAPSDQGLRATQRAEYYPTAYTMYQMRRAMRRSVCHRSLRELWMER